MDAIRFEVKSISISNRVLRSGKSYSTQNIQFVSQSQDLT